ncbi:peptide/nickel transport system permease protein [Frondihabitans sp. PhB188]|uniref:ABC transporter permease n=1 Tax=Frondihabitans sp. PhB188 TaxID=2485200 RepID=UPI000F474FE0|nr:ABC transporter permease [Frondihabitans sp. PhB188]ROQ38457.1 peptide/nickel transport system permease protein [Frondihabitans sp. PhB188]
MTRFSPDLLQGSNDETLPETPEEEVAASPNRAVLTIRRLFANRGAGVGLVVLILLFVFAFIGPLVTPWSFSHIDYLNLSKPPSGTHWFGTNTIGQDVFAQTARGMQKSLLIGLFVALFSTVIAGLLGSMAGYFGGWTDRIIMFVVDLMLVLPSFLIVAILSPRFRQFGWVALIVLLAVFGWMITARVVRSMTLSVKEREFVRAARYMGIGHFRIILRHILPNVASFLVVDASIAIGSAVLTEAGLSYFGFGVQSPDVSLGTLIANNQDAALTKPWLFYFSAGALVVFALASNLLGDGLRDALDPTSTAGRKGRRRRRTGVDSKPAGRVTAMTATDTPTPEKIRKAGRDR